MNMVSVLFGRVDSVYKSLGCDVWDIERDARNYKGPNPVICHPPCRAWGGLRQFAKPREDEKELAVFAIEQVRKWGGVLEHPLSSTLWPVLSLPTGLQYDHFGGFSMCIYQSWFGHRAQKKTLLYIVGIKANQVPAYPVTFDTVTRTIKNSQSKKYFMSKGRVFKSEVGKAERERTPLKMASWLIELAELCRQSQ